MKKMWSSTLGIVTLLILGLIVLSNTALAAEESAEALAKKSQNPVSSLISVPFEANFKFNSGPKDKTDFVLNIKPVIPVRISEDWNLINRVITPVIYQGSRGPGLGGVTGLGDITYQAFFSPAKPGKVIWGLGPQVGIPTGTDRLTSDQWTIGPTAVVLSMPGHWVLGAVASNSWNIGEGYNDAPNVHFFSLQYFVNYNMQDGWYLTSAPTITANWKAGSDDKWTVPFGGGAGRVFKIGNQSINAKLAAYYNVEAPDDASDWTLQATAAFLFPKGR